MVSLTNRFGNYYGNTLVHGIEIGNAPDILMCRSGVDAVLFAVYTPNIKRGYVSVINPHICDNKWEIGKSISLEKRVDKVCCPILTRLKDDGIRFNDTYIIAGGDSAEFDEEYSADYYDMLKIYQKEFRNGVIERLKDHFSARNIMSFFVDRENMHQGMRLNTSTGGIQIIEFDQENRRKPLHSYVTLLK